MLYLVRLPSTRKVVCILFDCSPHTKGFVIDSIRPRRDRVLLSCRTPQHKRTRDTELAGHCKESDPRLRRAYKSTRLRSFGADQGPMPTVRSHQDCHLLWHSLLTRTGDHGRHESLFSKVTRHKRVRHKSCDKCSLVTRSSQITRTLACRTPSTTHTSVRGVRASFALRAGVTRTVRTTFG